MKKAIFIFFILIVGFACPSCEKKQGGTEQRSSLQIGNIAPDFTLKDIRGAEVRLSDFRGKVVLVEFWATWCPPCRATVADLIEVQKRYKDKGLVVLGISVDEGENLPRRLSEFSEDHKMNYFILLSDGTVEHAYQVNSIPKSFIIDREGKVVHFYMGYSGQFKTAMSAQIDKIL